MKKSTFFIDLLALLVFVLIGRDAHKHSFSIVGIASTLWPFASGLLIGWLLIRLRKLDGATKKSGFVIVLTTVSAGMVLRVISGQGTALTFIIVALTFLSLILIGWRLLASKTNLPLKKSR
jgi:hypothetical protein